jgi:anti-sigma factor RsiW
MSSSGYCDWVQTHLHAFADGELAPAHHAECERHMEGCASCRAELAEIVALRDFIAFHAPPVPRCDSLAPRVLARMDGMERGGMGVAFRFAAALSLAASLTLGFAAGLKLMHPPAAEAQWQLDPVGDIDDG